MDEDGELKQDNGSSGGSDNLIIQTASESVVAAILLGMLFTAFVAWSDIGYGDAGICTYDVEGLGFWIYEHEEQLCWFSVTGMIWVGIFLTIVLSPLTFPLSFLAILISRRKWESNPNGTDPKP
jgi:hypothetical protein